MRRISVSLVVLAAFCGVGLKADDDTLSFRATLSSFQETPTLSTPGTGTFTATVRNTNAGIQIQYRLSYSNLSGTAVVAHIHLGLPAIAGGVAAFLCGGGGKPTCPASGAVEGTIVAADVIGPTAQGIAAGAIKDVVHAMQAGAVYANVHTSPNYANGEIRGTVRQVGGDSNDDRGNDNNHGHKHSN